MLLVLEGQRPGRISALFGVSRMTLERWVHGTNREGPQALIAKPRPGRPTQLTVAVRRELEQHLEKSPQEFGLPRAAWDGPTLVIHLKERFGVQLKVRQAQVWMHRLGYSLKRASYAYLQARADDSAKFGRGLKKTAPSEARGDYRLSG